MGRFEKQPDNPRSRGDLSRSAETALWAIVEDLENLQQNVLRSLQEEIKRLQVEKNRLVDEIQQLVDEKEHLQQVRHITEQQVLIRQLAEALAKHISSQLQEKLAILASQVESERNTLKPFQSSNLTGDNNENSEKLLGNLDDTLTIAFNSLQQELKNYQSNLSQQLSRMYSQQQQGETILEEFINQLRRELTTTTKEPPVVVVKSSPPTVLQFPEPRTESSLAVVKPSPPTVLQPPEPQAANPPQTSPKLTEVTKTASEPISVITEKSSQSNTTEPISVISGKSSESNTKEPISVIPKELPQNQVESAPVSEKVTEPISVINKESSQNQTTSPPPQKKAIEPVSVFNRNVSQTEPPPEAPAPKQSAAPSSPRSRRSSSTLSPIQIGFLLIVLSTVMSSLYNVAIKGMFYKTTQTVSTLAVEGLISPTVGNIMLILTLRLMVVVPLMILLAPMMYPQVWQDLQNLGRSVRGNSANTNAKTQRVLPLAIASGCFLFLSQVLIYLSLGQVSAGMAIALFFVYPLITGLLSWLLLGDRPNKFRLAAIGAIFCGELLVLGGSTNSSLSSISLGSSAALFAGLAFACYVILTRLCATKIHPVSFTLINFSTMLVLSFTFLMLPLPDSWSLAVDPSKLLEIILSAFILGVLTLVGYVFNHLGIHKLGASRSAIIGAGVPILTVIFAGLIIQETLEIIQILGVLILTFGAAAFSFDKMRNQSQPSSQET